MSINELEIAALLDISDEHNESNGQKAHRIVRVLTHAGITGVEFSDPNHSKVDKLVRYEEALKKIASCKSHTPGDVVDTARKALNPDSFHNERKSRYEKALEDICIKKRGSHGFIHEEIARRALNPDPPTNEDAAQKIMDEGKDVT